MRMLSSALIASLLVLGLAGPGDAAQIPVGGSTLSVQVSTLDPISLTAQSGVATVGGSGASITMVALPNGVFATGNFVHDPSSATVAATPPNGGGLTVPVTDPGAFPIVGIKAIIKNQAGTLSASAGPSGGFGGALALAGANRVCLFLPCSSPPPSNLSVPVSVVGQGGSVTVVGNVNLTVGGAPWTTGTISVDDGNGGAVTAMGSAVATSNGTQIQGRLVTPIFISTNIGSSAIVPALASIQFNAPEPETLALGAAAIASLLVMGWRRRRAS
jgi:hypothetical protein